MGNVLDDETRGKPFATASFIRDEQYLRDFLQALTRQQNRWYVLPVLVLVFSAAAIAFFSGEILYGWVALAIGIYLLFYPALVTRRWMRIRMAAIAKINPEMEVIFFSDTVVISSDLQTSESAWNIFRRAVNDEAGLLIYTNKAQAFYIPKDNIQPRSAIATVLQKVNGKNQLDGRSGKRY